MLPCIACKKHATSIDDEDDEDDHNSSNSIASKEVKSLSSQLKDVVLKVSAAYRQCRPCSGLRGDTNLASHEQEFTTTSDASSSDGWISHKKTAGSKLKPGSSSTASSVSEGNNKQDQECSKVSPSSQISNSSKAETSSETQEEAPGATQEWVAQVEPGVLITFIAMPNGENELKRIRFSRELFNRWQAEAWWAENCERVHELYNVSGNDRSFPNSRKEDREEQGKQEYNPSGTDMNQKMKTTATTTDELTEWVEEDEPGVYITVKLGPSGNRELKRVRFSREKFTEKQAKLWWEKNRFRIHDNYL